MFFCWRFSDITEWRCCYRGEFIIYGMEGELGSLYTIHTYTNTFGNLYLSSFCIFLLMTVI